MGSSLMERVIEGFFYNYSILFATFAYAREVFLTTDRTRIKWQVHILDPDCSQAQGEKYYKEHEQVLVSWARKKNQTYTPSEQKTGFFCDY